MNNKLTGIVIAGGKSSRMGQNKALMNFNGKRLIDNAIDIIRPIVDTIFVSSNELLSNIEYPLLKDKYQNIGPISGLYSCLVESKTEYNIIIPCDVPLVTTQFYLELIKQFNGYDAVIPKLPNGKIEPLVAIYSKSILKVVHEQIQAKNYKLVNLFSLIKVKYVDVNDSSMFKNVNKPTDIE